jgi:pyruvate/2-oxoglutarate dehydrogenase complex dihydrolipoamide acyltransferase (E2) component
MGLHLPLPHRPDAHPAAAPGYRTFMPALMPTRNGSVVFLEQQVRVAGAERFVAETKAAHPDLDPTVFHILLWALAQTLHRHPRINRFVAGGRLYERDGVWITFTAKTELSEEGTLVEVKHRFDPEQPLPDLVRDLQVAIDRARHESGGAVDKELDLFLRLPPLLRRGVVQVAGAANALNLLPGGFIANDPFFASAFVTNLGSVGLDAAFHHLYEYGTIPIFCVLGRIHDEVVAEGGEPLVARVATVRFTYDERVEDGLYAAHALADFKALLEDPDGH